MLDDNFQHTENKNSVIVKYDRNGFDTINNIFNIFNNPDFF